MKAIVSRCYGSPDVLTLEDIAKPVPGDDEVLVKVVAASVNPLDWHGMRGSPYIMRLSSGLGTPGDSSIGVDFAGVVEAIGRNVTRYMPGDEVFGGRSGAFAEYVIIRENRALTKKPPNVTFEQAAAVPIAAITALQALRDQGKIKTGQKVLINGASGGVGTYAVQIAKYFGAEVTAVCSTRNVEMVRALGADHIVDYTKENYTDSGDLFDLIIDNVGNQTLAKNRTVLTPTGTLVIVGAAKGDWVAPLISALKALVVSPFVEQELGMFIAQLNQDDLGFLAGLMESGAMTSVIDDNRYRLSDVPAAIRYSEEGHARGKIVVNIP
ncbi:MAG: NAD(P)-dependent alcohol dehydrogenase [Proteobacteria bacterium]|nr:NAD(P)-dependent alcohol dehydrogenase [Pseudomonadota bacterium]MDA0992641.1 NAD(P)-dependent alcohol dehydrogenase [Pseudomonadota bacterium]